MVVEAGAAVGVVVVMAAAVGVAVWEMVAQMASPADIAAVMCALVIVVVFVGAVRESVDEG